MKLAYRHWRSTREFFAQTFVRCSLLAALAAPAGCGTAAISNETDAALPSTGWVSPLRADHALVGRIWESATGRFISASELVAELEAKRYVLLGEKHDNPDHHALQWGIIEALATRGQSPGLVWEMLPTDIDPRLRSLASRHFDDDEQLASYVEWDKRGWNWEAYRELMWGSYQLGLPMRAGNISRSESSGIEVIKLPTFSILSSIFSHDGAN